ncbi:hypothetical protein DIDNDMLP_00282 [Klebsiella phage KP13-7]|nr:hypothetical protein DIDNDMLP_00282 [Klebsiella phage KP13-7]
MKQLFKTIWNSLFSKNTSTVDSTVTVTTNTQSTYIPVYSDENPFYTEEEKKQWIEDEVRLRKEEAERMKLEKSNKKCNQCNK